MRNYVCVGGGVDVVPVLLELARQPELWDQNALRTTHPQSPHIQVSDIWLRFNELPEPGQEHLIVDKHESVWYPAADNLPAARDLIHALIARVKGIRLGRSIITRLAPGKKIDAHEDGGSHAAYYDRFHIVLQSGPGCLFRTGDETVQMRTGEVWWFDNSIEHEVINNSSDDRIHLIVDIKT